MAPRHKKRMAVAGLMLLGCEVLSGCGSDPRLKSLQGDAMATVTLPHATLQHTYTEKTHTALGMPVHAHVLREFTFSGVDPKVLVDEAAALATENGWHQEFRRDTGYIGSKLLADGAHLSITTGGPSRPSTLIIVLTADQANE